MTCEHTFLGSMGKCQKDSFQCRYCAGRFFYCAEHVSSEITVVKKGLCYKCFDKVYAIAPEIK